MLGIWLFSAKMSSFVLAKFVLAVFSPFPVSTEQIVLRKRCLREHLSSDISGCDYVLTCSESVLFHARGGC